RDLTARNVAAPGRERPSLHSSSRPLQDRSHSPKDLLPRPPKARAELSAAAAPVLSRLSPKALSRLTLTQKRYCACGPPIPTTFSPSLNSTRAVCVPPPLIMRFTSLPRRLPRSMSNQLFRKQPLI